MADPKTKTPPPAAATTTGNETTPPPTEKKKRTQQSAGAKMKTPEGLLSVIASGGMNLVEATENHLVLSNPKKNGALSVKPKPAGFNEAIEKTIADMEKSLEGLRKLVVKK